MSLKHLAQGSKFPPLEKGVLRLYSMIYCPYVHRTRLVLEAKQIRYETVNVNLKNKPDWFLEKTPMAKVPVLEKDDMIIYESLVCNDWLDEVYPNKLHPADPYRRATDMMLLERQSKFINAFHRIHRSLGQDEDAVKDFLIGSEPMEEDLIARGKFFGGESPCMLDYNLWPFYERLPVAYGLVDGLKARFEEKYPLLVEWIKRMLEDPAVKSVFIPGDRFLAYYKSSQAGNPNYDVPVVLIGLCIGNVLMEVDSSDEGGLYNVDKAEISVSGISSGGAMAIQFHVAFSSKLKGVGSFAGIPFDCSNGDLITALSCMSTPSGINVETLAQRAIDLADAGKIDETVNLQNARVFVWAGSADVRVNPGASDKIKEFYQYFNAHVDLVNTEGAAHTQPTRNYGNACGVSSTPFISNCDYDGAYEALNTIHGDLIKPTGIVNLQGKFIEFNQLALIASEEGEYVNTKMKRSTHETPGSDESGTVSESMDSIGFAYIPSGCIDKSKACKLHVAFHGCQQGRVFIGDVFARHAGYNDVAELNDIIIIYPQAVPNEMSNPSGCWDWWGYESPDFNNQKGPQMEAVYAMIRSFAGEI